MFVKHLRIAFAIITIWLAVVLAMAMVAGASDYTVTRSATIASQRPILEPE